MVGLLKLQWRTPSHDWLVEFINIYQIKGKTLYAKMVENIIVIDKHLIIDVFKISNKGWKEKKE